MNDRDNSNNNSVNNSNNDDDDDDFAIYQHSYQYIQITTALYMKNCIKNSDQLNQQQLQHSNKHINQEMMDWKTHDSLMVGLLIFSNIAN